MSAPAKLETAPRERPILFKGEMVRAILEGRKTQTRRVVKPSPGEQAGWLKVEDLHGFVQSGETVNGGWQMWHPKGGPRSPFGWVRCPFGVPGDRLWVRETFVLEWPEMDRPEDEEEFRRWVVPHYAATGPKPDLVDQNTERPLGWRPSIFMPRWACRLVLEITDVRVERVASISEKDAKAEGVTLPECTYVGRCHSNSCPRHGLVDPHRQAFRSLWDSINEPRGFGWDANPWVWCVSFKAVTP